MRVLRVLVCALALPAAAVAQETQEVTVQVSRGALAERPYTVIYPQPLQIVEDGDDVTVATLQYPGAPLQCDAMVADGGAADWSAEAAASSLDKVGTAEGWLEQFPGFAISEVGTIAFQSGPALFYRGESQESPLGGPATVFHAEAVDTGRTYIFECLTASSLAPDAKTLIDFLFANFSTRSDGECCVDPAAKPE